MGSVQIRRESTPLPPRTAVCLGAFDGLHRGHAALIERARSYGDRVALVTFDPHPQRVLAPQRPLQLLLGAAQRERTAAALGVHTLVLLHFDLALAKMSAEEFIDGYLAALAPVAVVVGADFRFGAGRSGDATMLAAALPRHGIAVDVVEPVAQSGGPGPNKIGSTAIRRAIAAGDVAAAHTMLGRPHAVLGTVVRGDRRGRSIGVPTANVDAPDAPMPAFGVYAVWLSPLRPSAALPGPAAAVANLGTSPTFAGERKPRLEVHVLDRDLGLPFDGQRPPQSSTPHSLDPPSLGYGAEVEVWFVDRIRDEQHFSGKDALVAQIHADMDVARARLQSAAADGVLPPPTPTARGDATGDVP